jgi:hypothetical protein
MQKITFKNKNEDSLTFSRSFPYLLESISGIGTAQSEPISQRGFQQDGENYFGSLLEPRGIAFSLWIKGDSRQDLIEKRQVVMKVFNPKQGLGTLTYENEVGSWSIPASVDGSPNGGEGLKNALVQKFTVSLYCPDPAWLEAEAGEQEEEFTAFSGGLIFPFSSFEADNVVDTQLYLGTQGDTVVINNNGNLGTPLIIEFIGPGSRHRLIDVDTGEKIELDVDLKDNESLFVETKPQHINAYKVVGSNEKLVSFQYLKPESQYFCLNEGTNNIKFSAAHGNATAKINWTERFVGV